MLDVYCESTNNCDFMRFDVEKFDMHSASGIKEKIFSYISSRDNKNLGKNVCIDLSNKTRYIDCSGLNVLEEIERNVGYKRMFLLLDPNKDDAIKRFLDASKKKSLFTIIHSKDEIKLLR